MNYVILNGELIEAQLAQVSVFDRGFTLGDGIFETLKAEQGKLKNLAAHLRRLRSSAVFFRFKLEVTEKDLARQCHTLLAKNNLLAQDACIRFTLSRGVSERGIDLPAQSNSTLLVTAQAYRAEVTPIRLQVSHMIRYSKSLIAQHKTLNYLDAIMARAHAREAGFDDALFVNEKNQVVCATAANIFFVKAHHCYTPSVSCGALPGIMRGEVIKACQATETEITCDEISAYDACFLTNSLMGQREVRVISGEELGQCEFT